MSKSKVIFFLKKKTGEKYDFLDLVTEFCQSKSHIFHFFYTKILKKKTGKKYDFLDLVAEFAAPVLEIIDLQNFLKKKTGKKYDFLDLVAEFHQSKSHIFHFFAQKF